MRGSANLKVWTSEVLLGIAERIRGCQGWEPASRQVLIRARLLGMGVLLVMGIDLGRCFLAG
jgi:hypothetical protein